MKIITNTKCTIHNMDILTLSNLAPIGLLSSNDRKINKNRNKDNCNMNNGFNLLIIIVILITGAGIIHCIDTQ